MYNIPFEGASNIRDLGGITTRSGQIIREGLIIRADALHSLTDADIRILQDMSLKTIIDMRTAREAGERPDRNVPGALYRNIRIFEEARTGVTREKEATIADHFRGMPHMNDIYREIITNPHCIRQMGHVVRTVMDPASQPVLFHCTAGKDRTGLAAMFILTILGADRDMIFEDYMRTNETAVELARRFAERILAESGDTVVADHIRTAFVASEEYLQSAYDAIEDSWGTVDRYIEDAFRITEEMKNAFRSLVLE